MRVSEMRNHRTFRFDEDKAYEDQLVSVLEASSEHPLPSSEAPRQPGVIMFFFAVVCLYTWEKQKIFVPD